MCYKCLFGSDDEGFNKVESRVLRRRALYLLQSATFAGHHELAQVLRKYLETILTKKHLIVTDCSFNATSQILKEFRAAKLMALANRGGKTPLTLFQAEDVKARVKEIYFAPTYGIEKYVSTTHSNWRRFTS